MASAGLSCHCDFFQVGKVFHSIYHLLLLHSSVLWILLEVAEVFVTFKRIVYSLLGVAMARGCS